VRLASLVILAAGLLLARPGSGLADSEAVGWYSEVADDPTPRPAIGYRKGKRLRIEVVSIGWAYVEVSTATGFAAMREAAAADGVELWIRSGFRDHETQRWLYLAWREGWGNKAARPGHSNHQSGRALDLDIQDPAVLPWLETHGKKFGFKRTVRGEPWHWEYVKKPKKKRAKKPAKKR